MRHAHAHAMQAAGALKRAEALHQRMMLLAMGGAAGLQEAPAGGVPGNGWSTHGAGSPAGGAAPPPPNTCPQQLQQQQQLLHVGPMCQEAARAMHAYATFCLRRGAEAHGRAEQVLRRVLGLPPSRCSTAWPAAAGGSGGGASEEVGSGLAGESSGYAACRVDSGAEAGGGDAVCGPHHASSLLALAALLLHHGRVTDSMLLEEAAELAHQVSG